ncbi:MAG: hypothetical protein V1818_03745 [Candidatus Aenigmatarchaeota archaeon]
MKALTLNIVLVLIGIALLTFLAVSGFYDQIVKADIAAYITSGFEGCGRAGQECCKGEWCVEGLDCSGGICIEEFEINIIIPKDYLIYNTTETFSRSEMDDYFKYKEGLGWEDCSNGVGCTECRKQFDIQNAIDCEECELCEDGLCKKCLKCQSAETGTYNDLYECYECSGCDITDIEGLVGIQNDMSDSCSACASCDIAYEPYISSGLSCDSCYQCDLEKVLTPSGECYSCWDCGSEEMVCDSCSSSVNTVCEKKHDYVLCRNVKNCILSKKGDMCQLDEFLIPDFLRLPWLYDDSYISQMTSILKQCVEEDVKITIPELLERKVFEYDNSKINFIQDDYTLPSDGTLLKIYFEADDESYVPPARLLDMLTSDYQYGGVTGETKGLLFNDCGVRKTEPISKPDTVNEIVYNNDPVLFESSTTPKMPNGDIPVSVKTVVTDISWNEQNDNDGSYSLYLCGQEAIATGEEDPILNVYDFFAYFNESEADNFASYREWSIPYNDAMGAYHVNVTVVKYVPFEMDITGRTADIAHIAKAAVAGIRDYFVFNSETNRTMKFFCFSSGIYDDFDDCYGNISVVLNDRMPWKLKGLYSSVNIAASPPSRKFIYYNDERNLYSGTFEIELAFFMYTTNFTEINKTIFVSPVLIIDGSSIPGSTVLDFTPCEQRELQNGFVAYGYHKNLGTVYAVDYELWGTEYYKDPEDIRPSHMKIYGVSMLSKTDSDISYLNEDPDNCIALCASGAEMRGRITEDDTTCLNAAARCSYEEGFLRLLDMVELQANRVVYENMQEDAEEVEDFIEEIKQKVLAVPVTYTIGVMDGGGSICADSLDIDQFCVSDSLTRDFEYCQGMLFTANPDEDYTFMRFKNSTNVYYGINPMLNFAREGEYIYADFNPTLYYTLAVAEGSGSLCITGIDFPVSGCGYDASGTVVPVPKDIMVSLTATPALGFTFNNIGTGYEDIPPVTDRSTDFMTMMSASLYAYFDPE